MYDFTFISVIFLRGQLVKECNKVIVLKKCGVLIEWKRCFIDRRDVFVT